MCPCMSIAVPARGISGILYSAPSFLFTRIMSLLNSFIHGDKLTEFLIEGHNPDARLTLSQADVQAVRQHLTPGDSLRAYVSGRIVMSGAGVWALTAQHLLMLNTALRQVTTVETRHLEHFEAVRGRYGHTVRLHAQGRQYSLYGVDVDLARHMHEALQAMGAKSLFEDKPPRGTLWAAYSGPHLSADECLNNARARMLAA